MRDAFRSLAVQFSKANGGPFHAGVIERTGAPVIDAGGSITSAGTVTTTPVQVQVDDVTHDMRQDADFIQGDMRLIVLATGIDTNCVIEVEAGPHVGRYQVRSVNVDPVAIGTVCRARPE